MIDKIVEMSVAGITKNADVATMRFDHDPFVSAVVQSASFLLPAGLLPLVLDLGLDFDLDFDLDNDNLLDSAPLISTLLNSPP